MHRKHAGSAKGDAHKAAAAIYQDARRSYNKAAISNVNSAGRDVIARHVDAAHKFKSAADAHARKHGIYATVERK